MAKIHKMLEWLRQLLSFYGFAVSMFEVVYTFKMVSASEVFARN